MGFLDRVRRGAADPQEILDGELLVPTPDTGQARTGSRVLEANEELAVVLVSDDDGLTVLPAFTSEKALSRWKTEGSTYVGLPGRVLVELLAESDWDRMVVDGGSPAAFAVTRSAAQKMLEVATLSAPAGSSVRVGQPAIAPPDGLKEEVVRACERESAVLAAYLFQLEILEMNEPPHLAVGLQLDGAVDEAKMSRILQAIGTAVQPGRWGYDFLDYHVLSDEMLDLVSSDSVAVYRRAGTAAG